MGSSGNLSKLVIPKQHWQECKDKNGYMNICFKDMGPDSRGVMRSKLQWWVAFSLCAFLVTVPLLMFVCAVDNIEVTAKRQPWISLDGPPLEFIGVHSRWSLLRGGRAIPSDDESRGMIKSRAALQGMGTLHRTGTRAMQELIVAHLTEDTTSEELRLFLRSLHRSGSTARADIVLLFPSSPMPVSMAKVIHEEEESFQKLLEDFKPEVEVATVTTGSASTDVNSTMVPFNFMTFKRPAEDEQEALQEIIWGRRHGLSSEGETVKGSSHSWATWGSVVSFDIQELDPQDALQGFFDTPPVQLRRWVCYDMLLGMIKSRFKNVLVSQVKGVYVLGDALSATRKKQTLYITAEDMVWSDAKREPVATRLAEEVLPESNDESFRSTVVDLPAARHESIRRSLRESSKPKAPEDGEPGNDELKESSTEANRFEGPRVMKTVVKEAQTWRQAQGLIQSVYGPQVWSTLEEPDKQHAVVSPAVIMGAVQYVRGLANKMTSEIVRVAIERKSRRTFHDKAVLNMWIHKKPALGKRIAEHLKVVKNQDSVVHSVQGSHQPFLLWRRRDESSRYLVVHEEHGGATTGLRQELCRLDSSFYQRCL
ncbi:hypothetical protein M758_1G019300 [Ceratodon purpureus]|nr:hypothetical protein M758_1G019300 [Ceratodon purpureus]